MNITQESEESRVIQIQEELDKIWDEYATTDEDDKDKRRKLRASWKALTEEHTRLTKFTEIYRKVLP